jgi:hypothetical protein
MRTVARRKTVSMSKREGMAENGVKTTGILSKTQIKRNDQRLQSYSASSRTSACWPATA